MSKGHIAILVMSAHGHINPTLGIASELLARGYRVTYSTDEGPLADMLRDLDYDVVAHDPTMSHEGFSTEEDRIQLAINFDVSTYVGARLKALDFFCRDPPNFVFYDYGESVFAALISAKLPNVPAIRSCPSFVYNKRFTAVDGGEDWSADIPADVRATQETAIAATLSKFGVESSVLGDVPPSSVVFIPRFFQYAEDSFDHRYTFVGPSIKNRPNYGNWTHRHRDRKVVLISLGTVLNANIEFFRACISSLQDLDMHFVMSVGRGVDVAALGCIPENFETFQFVSHLDVLPYSSVYIGHGGMNSTMEAMWHGVPMLLSPRDRHQKVISQRVASLSLGHVLTDLSQGSDLLKVSLLRLLNDEGISQHMRAVAQELRSRDAVADVVAMIEERLHRDSR